MKSCNCKKQITIKISIYTEILIFATLFVLGLIVRINLISHYTADTGNFILWFNYVKDIGNFSAFKDFIGDYNVAYVALLYLSTFLPFSDIVCVKLTAILFDFFGIAAGYLLLHGIATENGLDRIKSRRYGEIGALLLWLSPIAISNSALQGQLEALWTFCGFLSLYLVLKKHPVLGMIFFGFAFSMKPQGIFFLPVLLWIYYRSKSFSILHFLIVPVTVQILCIPSMLGGNSFLFFWEHFLWQSTMYPYLYCYYPNIWIWMRDLPYWAFSKVGIGMMITAFVVYTVRYVKDCRERIWTLEMDLELAIWSLMTCAMFLPAMHERYNYPAEVMLPLLAVFNRRYRIPAVFLVVSGILCNRFSYYNNYTQPEFYGLSILNIIVYVCLTLGVINTLTSTSGQICEDDNKILGKKEHAND